MKWTPDLIVALVLLVGCFALLFSGIDGEVKSVLTLAAGWAFGSSYTRLRSNNRGATKK